MLYRIVGKVLFPIGVGGPTGYSRSWAGDGLDFYLIPHTKTILGRSHN
jgi:hypothetical protein